ncbi:hypothetical protein [Nocardia sp. NBC_01327]|uniref:hypothetical protein n=1 Tax=Nocardia sp. NBC_01327 TaxID=2903593 RepID=UPI002E100C07|nr:hypothetical protein OG326_34645 [Nocardia sp. NBC_01327]
MSTTTAVHWMDSTPNASIAACQAPTTKVVVATMARAKKPISRRVELRLGREIQEQYERGRTWAAIAVDFDISKTKAQRLAKVYREDCDRRAHQNQLTLFG